MKWLPLDEYAKSGAYVILGGPSGFRGTPIRARVCKYDPVYRPNQPWVDYSGDSFLDDGEAPTCYMPLPDNGKEFEEVKSTLAPGTYLTCQPGHPETHGVRYWDGKKWSIFGSTRSFGDVGHYEVISKVGV